MNRRDDLTFRQEMKFRNKLVEYLTDWIMGNSHQLNVQGDVTLVSRSDEWQNHFQSIVERDLLICYRNIYHKGRGVGSEGGGLYAGYRIEGIRMNDIYFNENLGQYFLVHLTYSRSSTICWSPGGERSYYNWGREEVREKKNQ